MATQPATPINQNRKREWVEAKAPEMFKFTRMGEELVGVLIAIEPTVIKQEENGKVRESHTVEYTLDVRNWREGADRVTFLGTNDLNKKIHSGLIGHCVAIKYETDDSSFVKPGQNAAKIIKVMVSKEKEPDFAG